MTPPSSGRLADEEIFPAADYAHRLRLKRSDPVDFFQAWSPDTSLLAERAHWITTFPERHALALPEAAAPLHELALWTRDRLRLPWPTIPSEPGPLLRILGTLLEPDLVVLSHPPGRPARLIAASVCFPSSWAPEDKLGTSLSETHAVVPNLNAELGDAIDGFLERLKPGAAWLRANWGLSASPDLNQHPARCLPRLELPLDPGRVWVRIEHQALFVLPNTRAIVFGIRIDNRPLVDFREASAHAQGLAQALRSMPESMARYKGVTAVRGAVADFLAASPA